MPLCTSLIRRLHMTSFRNRRFVLGALCAALSLCIFLQQGLADKSKKSSQPYAKARAAKIQYGTAPGISSFSSVVHALYGIDYFKRHHNHGKKNRSKQAIHALFQQLGTKKVI